MPPLSGIRVLDLTRLLPGPYGTMILADHGADVIKVEDPEGGDPIRQMKGQVNGIEEVFAHINRGKRSLTLNLRTDDGKAIFRELLEHADVLAEGFRPGVMQRLGLDFSSLKGPFPKLIYCSISGFGQSGAKRDLPGHDLNYLGYAGLLPANQDGISAPAMPPTLLADLHAGHCAALGIVLALQERVQTGVGQYVDVDMTRALAPFLLPGLGILGRDGEKSPPSNAWFSGGLACYNVYRTADARFVTLAALEEKFWREFCNVARRPDLAEGHLDIQRQAMLRDEVARIIQDRPQHEWLELAQNHDICIGPVRSQAEALADTHIRHAGWPDPCTTAVRVSPPPAKGSHTRQILVDELGYDPTEIERYQILGIV